MMITMKRRRAWIAINILACFVMTILQILFYILHFWLSFAVAFLACLFFGFLLITDNKSRWTKTNPDELFKLTFLGWRKVKP